MFSCIFYFFFFSSRRRHTRSLCDWSSDVCSSDLPLAFSPYSLLAFASYTRANKSPPIPFIIGSTTPIMAFVAMAASTAFPPCSRMRTPACAASGDSAATIPFREITIERAWPRSCPWLFPVHMIPATKRNMPPQKTRTALSFLVPLKDGQQHPSRHRDDDIRDVLLAQHGVEWCHVLGQNLLILLLELIALIFEFLSHRELLRCRCETGGRRVGSKIADLARQQRRPLRAVLP